MPTTSQVRTRLRFAGLDHVTQPDGSGRVSVRLEWNGDTFEGVSGCLETPQGVIRAASKAALQAMLASAEDVTSSDFDLEVAGVKAVRAFDGWVVVTRLSGSNASTSHRLLGAAPCEAEDDLPAAAVRAVLNASNRILGHRIAR